MCNIYKNNLNTLLKLNEKDLIYYENVTLHIEDRYLCQLRGHNNPDKVIDIFLNSYNNYYNHFIIPGKNKLLNNNGICDADVDIGYFKNCIKGIKLYINNISNQNINYNKYINRIEELERTTIDNYYDEKKNCKDLVDSISESKNYGFLNYFFNNNKENLEGKVYSQETNLDNGNSKHNNNNKNNNNNMKISNNTVDNVFTDEDYESDNQHENNNNNDNDFNINERPFVLDEENVYSNNEDKDEDDNNQNKYFSYEYLEGLVYIVGIKLTTLFISVGNHIRYIFFFKDH